MPENQTCNEILSFYEMLQKYKIEIPIIQRDYAQGRIGNEQIRKNFLEALKSSLVEEKSINLDFVYGNIFDSVFQPLDGQQRLTTLYLLHWYAFVKYCPSDSNVKSTLLQFSYETRISSREFCNSLISNPIPIIGDEDKISDVITDSEWFFMSWNQDPTIRAMLNAIDDINYIFKDVDDLWRCLTEKRLITFHLLILENFGLSDDLYIKMNARGKLLTSFENFKAELQKESQDNNWEEQVTQTDLFAHKIDTKWTNFLWSNFRHDNAIDDAHMRFITALIMVKISTGQPSLKPIERFEYLQRLNDNYNERYLVSLVTEETFKFIYECYDAYSSLFENEAEMTLNSKLIMWRHQPSKNLLSEILLGSDSSDNSTYTHKVLFYAQTEYLLRNPIIDSSSFYNWMRVVRNIVSRADITSEGKRPDIVRSPDTFSGAINLIKELASGCNDIYCYLLNNDIKSSFAKEQMKEEKIKANIIITYPEHKDLIFKIEDNELLRGKIMFALQCANYRSDINEIDFAILSNVQKAFETYFNDELKEESLDLLRRAMLTIEVGGAYEFYLYWWSYWNAGKADKRRLFVQFREIEYFIGCDQKEYFEKLILLLTQKDFNSIINDFQKPNNMPNWQYRIIKEEHLLKDECKSKYIAIPSDKSCCYLLRSKRPSDLEGSPRIT